VTAISGDARTDRQAPPHCLVDTAAAGRAREESGQITAMLVIFSLCALLAVVAVTDVSASYLRRQSATSLADGAALAATGSAVAVDVYGSADDDFVRLDPAAAQAAVDTYLRDTGSYAAYPGLTAVVVVEGDTVRVSLTMPFTLPVPVPGVDPTTTIHASGSAQMPIY
jgi:hypothetical protein